MLVYCIWNQQKHKTQGGIFLIRLTEAGKPTLNVGGTFWWQLRLKDIKEGNVAICLLVSTLAGKSSYPVAAASLHWHQNYYLWDSNIE